MRDSLIERLKSELALGQVVVIAGTGVSVAACGAQEVDGFKVATWPGLLLHGVHYCHQLGVADDMDCEILKTQIKSGKIPFLISAAEDVSQRMRKRGDGIFRGWLKNTVGKLQVKYPEIPAALAALPVLLATLNYDNLLEVVTGRRAINWQDPDAVQDVLRGITPDAVLHLHGYFENSDSVVLGAQSYQSVKVDPHASAVLNLFTIARTLLFVGCGDTVLDPNFSRLIEWGKDALKEVTPRHFLLCRTSEIAEVRKKIADAPWLQALDYGDRYDDLAPFLQGLVPPGGAVKPRPIGPGFDLVGYQRAMQKAYGRLKLEQFDATTHDVRPLMLTGAFIPQNARECAEFLPRVFELPKELQDKLRKSGELNNNELDAEVLKQHRRAYLDQSPRPIVEILEEPAFQKIVVLGDPGSGKSTLLQYRLLQWAESAGVDLTSQPLPLLVELREYGRLRHKGEVHGFLDYFQSGENVRWQFDAEQLDKWLRSHPSLLLFDGLDEIFDLTLRREVSTAIHRLAELYPLSRIIVTSRIFGYQHQTWGDEGFRHFMLQDLDDPQIGVFLDRWHRGAYDNESAGKEKRSMLARAIQDSRAIRQLAGNPLLLTMMAILNRTQDLPRDRAELYEQCARLLLHQWKVDLAFADDPELAHAKLDFKDKRELMLQVARVMQTSDKGLAGNLIDESTLEATLAAGLQGTPNIRPEHAARVMIAHLRGRNFMICSVGGNNYAFVHRTFLEYFCAAEIDQRFKDQILDVSGLQTEVYSHWKQEIWHEVLTLLAGMLPEDKVAAILQWLLEQQDRDQAWIAVFLAARCVGDVRKRTELGVVESYVLVRLKQLTKFDLSYFYERWENEAQMVSEIRQRAVRLVAGLWCHVTTYKWLKDLAKNAESGSVRRIAVGELARGWRDEPQTLTILKDLAQSDVSGAVRRIAVGELARGWKDDPQTLTILKVRAQNDDSGSVRRIAVGELARGWKDDPQTLPWLKDRAQYDDNYDVRQRCVQELARGWRGNPQALTVLKDRAQSDKHGAVRQIAVQELVRGWKDDPQTLQWLKDRAQCDDNYDVRRSAVGELARGWKDDPHTLIILKDRAQNDDNYDVRRSAVLELSRGFKDDLQACAILKDCAKVDVSGAVRQRSIQELARTWKDDPQTLTILKDLAQNDGHGAVRQIAVQELARGWKDDPQTLTILKDRAQNDDDNGVRQRSVQELARGWKDDTQTLLWLKDRAQYDDNYVVRQIAVRELARVWKDDPQTLPWLKDRAQDDGHGAVRQIAVQELARGWKDDPQTLPWLKGRAQNDGHGAVRQIAVQELARGWKDDPQTLTILKDRAQNDDDNGVRQRSVQELARGWKDDTQTLTILEGRAQNDADNDIRQRSVQELARGWKDAPETLPWLKDRAQNDGNGIVRLIAVQELARGWKDDPQTLPWLKDLTQNDDNFAVRQGAVQELARVWKDDPETLTILKDRVQNDKNGAVRQIAVQELSRIWKDHPETLQWLKNLAQNDDNSAVRRLAVQELARSWKDVPETLAILKDRVRNDGNSDVRRSAIGELARGWKDDPQTLPWLKDRAHNDDNNDVRQKSVQQLARVWKDNPETLTWLKVCAQNDDNNDVRRSAVQELARGWKDDPETLTILRKRAQDDADDDVRQSAVQELARRWKDAPETLPWLKDLAQNDDSGSVRRSAVGELARGWKDDPQTLTILKDRVRNDNNSAVRRRSIGELARGWKDDPQMLTILKDRAQNDEDNDVRQSAVRELARGWRDDGGVHEFLRTLP